MAGSLLLGMVVLGLATLVLLLGLALAGACPCFKALAIIAFGALIAVGKPFGFSPAFAFRLGGLPILLSMLGGAGVGILLR